MRWLAYIASTRWLADGLFDAMVGRWAVGCDGRPMGVFDVMVERWAVRCDGLLIGCSMRLLTDGVSDAIIDVTIC